MSAKLVVSKPYILCIDEIRKPYTPVEGMGEAKGRALRQVRDRTFMCGTETLR